MLRSNITIFLIIIFGVFHNTYLKSVHRREAFIDYAEPWSEETGTPEVLPCQCVSVFECGLAWKSESEDESPENPCKNPKEVCCERPKGSEGSDQEQKDRVVVPLSTEFQPGGCGTPVNSNSDEGKEEASSSEETKKGSCGNKKEQNSSEIATVEEVTEGEKDDEVIQDGDKSPVDEPQSCVCISPLKCGANWKSDDESDEKEEVGICTNPKEVCCYNFEPKEEEEEVEEGPKPLKCGETQPIIFSTSSFEINDDTAQFGEFPWTVILLNNTDQGFCTGTIVHESAIITAAHCMIHVNKFDITIRAGDWNIDEENIEPLPIQERGIKSWIPHPQFEDDYPPNDIAVIILDEPFYPSGHINKICLPHSIDDLETTKCVETGWGRYPGGKTQNTLVKIPMDLIPHRDCKKLLRKTQLGRYFQLDKSFSCARNGDRKEICDGNGGGPLSCPLKVTGHMTLVGVSSWGIGCGQGNPSMFTNVLFMNEWINEVLQQNDAIQS